MTPPLTPSNRSSNRIFISSNPFPRFRCICPTVCPPFVAGANAAEPGEMVFSILPFPSPITAALRFWRKVSAAIEKGRDHCGTALEHSGAPQEALLAELDARMRSHASPAARHRVECIWTAGKVRLPACLPLHSPARWKNRWCAPGSRSIVLPLLFASLWVAARWRCRAFEEEQELVERRVEYELASDAWVMSRRRRNTVAARQIP